MVESKPGEKGCSRLNLLPSISAKAAVDQLKGNVWLWSFLDAIPGFCSIFFDTLLVLLCICEMLQRMEISMFQFPCSSWSPAKPHVCCRTWDRVSNTQVQGWVLWAGLGTLVLWSLCRRAQGVMAVWW